MPNIHATTPTPTPTPTTMKFSRNLFVHKDIQLTPDLPLISPDATLTVPIHLIDSPLVGSQRVISIQVLSLTFEALLDTGAGSSFITTSLVHKLQLPLFKAPSSVSIRGAFSSNNGYSNHMVSLCFSPAGSQTSYEISLFVVDKIGAHDIIIGDPVLRLHPELLNSVLSTDSVTSDSYFDDAAAVYVISAMPLQPALDSHSDAVPDSRLQTLLSQYPTTIASTMPENVSDSPDYSHSIELLPNAALPKSNPFPVSLTEEQEISSQIDNLLSLGYIVPSTSPLASPVLLVKKKDGTFRMVIDYRKLNKATVDDPFPLPKISSLLAQIGSASIFSKLDLLNGYHQVKMNPPDAYKTAFVTTNGKYHYKVMPFGLKNAPATFSRMMADIFRSCPFVLVYLDDILIFSNSVKDHERHLKYVLDTLKANCLVAKQSKCEFFRSSVDFLGCTISHNSIQPSVDKVHAVQQMTVPSTTKEVKSFLGLINYIRKFIPNCSQISAPLVDFECGRVTSFGKEQLESFNKLKDLICSEPVLTTFKPSLAVRLTTDASIKGVGGYLEHIDDSGKTLGIIGYYSAALSVHEKNYPVRELELLGVVKCLEHFRYYLYGRRFVLRTDHQSLLSLKNLDKPPSGRLIRHLDKLAEYGYDIQHLKGTDNVVADPLSRLVDFTVEPTPVYSVTATPATIDSSTWPQFYAADPYCSAYLTVSNDDFVTKDVVKSDPLFKKLVKKFERSKIAMANMTVVDGIIHNKNRIVVPHQKIHELLETFHSHSLYGGHYAISKTELKLANYYFLKKTDAVKKFIQECTNCQLTKDTGRIEKHGKISPLNTPSGRWTDLSMDFITGLPLTPRGNNSILVVCCRFTKRAILIATSTSANAYSTWKTLCDSVFFVHGFPKTIVSDRDVRFTAAYFRQLCDSWKIKQLFSTTNHPQTDGQTERTIRTVVESMRSTLLDNHNDWDDFLKQAEFSYNMTPHSSIKMTPAIADVGYSLGNPDVYLGSALDARSDSAREYARLMKSISLRLKDAIEETRINMQSTNLADKKIEFKLNVGDLVLIHKDAYYTSTVAAKFGTLFIGPFKVIEVIGDNAYVVDIPKTVTKKHRTFNVNRLKPFYYDERYLVPPPRSPAEADQRCNEILSVVGISFKDKHILCKFKNVSPHVTIPVTFDAFFTLERGRCNSLLRNLKNALSHDTDKNDMIAIDSLMKEDVTV